MRKSSSSLVTYSSSESDDNDNEPEKRPTKKRRKLPSLSSSLLSPIPVDRPELHQGRIRTKPHVEGQWAAHIYVSLIVERHSALYSVISDVLRDAKETSPTLNDFWSSSGSPKRRELHISLSRPTYLRAHQREDLKRAVKGISKRFSPFAVSFATFAELVNDERTRTFLTMEVGAGHHELQAISAALTPTLQAIRQKEFYSDPRFHASIAWALLDRPSSPCHDLTPAIADVNSALAEASPIVLHAVNESPGPETESKFSTIPHLPKDLIPTLNGHHGARLSSTKTGIYDVDAISVKIGKEIHTWHFSGL
ncbi:hypothetical protein FPV67DRAFT_1410341 [Lyophyllum atratum]|nr:hypothetical protein FPV67DRAFT_1410341 [Lyophyllum atratum]